jgi:hypothetical protein
VREIWQITDVTEEDLTSTEGEQVELVPKFTKLVGYPQQVIHDEEKVWYSLLNLRSFHEGCEPWDTNSDTIINNPICEKRVQVVCYETIKRELNQKLVYECRCDERLKAKAER